MSFVKNLYKFLSLFLLIFLSLTSLSHVNAQVNNSDYAVVLSATPSSEDDSGVQKITIEIKSGKNSNSIFDVSFKSPTQNIKRDLIKGDIVLVRFNINPSDGKIQSVDIVDFYRVSNIFWIPILFILLFLIIVIVKYRRKIYIFSGVSLSTIISAMLIIFLRVNPVVAITICFSLMMCGLLFLLYKRLYIALIGLLLPLILCIFVFLLSYITLQITQVQLSFLSIIVNFYGLQNRDYNEAFYVAVLYSSIIGAIYISYAQILESVRIKVSDIAVSKKELTFKSFLHTVRNFDTIIFPSIGFLFGIMLSILIFIQRSIGIEAALNNDYWVSLSVMFFISFVTWVLSVPVCAMLCGTILGRMEQHKIVTDKTISILD